MYFCRDGKERSLKKKKKKVLLTLANGVGGENQISLHRHPLQKKKNCTYYAQNLACLLTIVQQNCY